MNNVQNAKTKNWGGKFGFQTRMPLPTRKFKQDNAIS
jgi:hypothetical protein